jgi:hypothetical protein
MRAAGNSSAGDLATRLAALEQMELESLRAEWLRLYRTASPPRLSRDLMARGIATKLQEAVHGGLHPAARRKLASLMAQRPTPSEAHVAPTASLRPGAMLVRTWRGQTHTVQVLPDGFEHQGQRYRTLSQIAKTITGAHWSGPRFFGLIASAYPRADDAQTS